MDFLKVRPATEADWPLIEGWRDEHYRSIQSRSRWNREVVNQRGLGDAAWTVFIRYGVPVAALSFTCDNMTTIRMWDLYAAKGHALAGYALYEHLERFADDVGFEIQGATDPENIEFLKVAVRRGYELTAVQFRRKPRCKNV